MEPYLGGIRYDDRVTGESDEVCLNFDDTSGKWIGTWLPTTGDKLVVQMGYAGGGAVPDVMLKCGEFTIDEVNFTGPPDMLEVKAVATSIKNSARSRKSHVYEKQKLSDIVGQVAGRNGLTVKGVIGSEFIKKETQYNESDLGFITRLLATWGYICNARGGVLWVWDVYKLEGQAAGIIMAKTDMSSYTIEAKTVNTVTSTRVRYWNPDEMVLVEGVHNAEGAEATNKQDVGEFRGIKVENGGAAAAMARAATHRTNSNGTTIDFMCPGNPSLVAGINIQITGFSPNFNGVYHITESTHELRNPGGYNTGVKAKKVG